MGFGDVGKIKQAGGGFGSIGKTGTAGGGFGEVGASSKNLDSSQGLYNLAIQSGLGNQAEEIRKNQGGEDVKQIFSGGFISDIFDVMNTFQYGTVGLLKGKSFGEGVRTRQSFTDQDALGNKGLPGVIGGTILDIAFDPFTYIAPYTLVKKVPAISRLVKAAKEATFGRKVEKVIEEGKTYQELEGGTKLGKYLASKVGWMFGADPIFRQTFEKSVKNIAVETQAIAEMGKAVADIAPETAAKLLTRDETGRFIRTPLEGLKSSLNQDELNVVTKFYKRIDDLGKEAVDLGLLGKEKYEENLGEYIKNAYTEYELAKSKKLFGYKKVGIEGIKKRVEGLTPEMMKELGQIDNPAYLLFKSAFDLTKDVENAKLLKAVAERFGTDIAKEGFAQIPKTEKWGNLSGKYVPQHMYDYLNEIIAPSKETIQKQLMANFKFFKVIMNPATHARNIISNKILNWWKLGMNPLDPRVISSDAEALKEITQGSGKWTELAKPHGYGLNTFASAEMKGLLESPEASTWGKTISGWQKIKQKLGNIYQAEENHAKLSAFIFNMKKGTNSEEAWKAAESATFNYAQVTPFIRKLRESLFGYPFITFTVKSTPVILETAVKSPARIGAIGKIKTAIENLSDIKETERERASEPPWIKDGFYIKLPMKDKQGRSAYFDLSYILPFGDLIAGNFFERQINRETGLPESYTTATIKKSPFINLVTELGKNQDFYGNKIWLESDSSEKQLGDLSRHLIKTMAPPLLADQILGGYNAKGVRQQRGIVGALTPQEKENQQRTLMQELLRNIGAKIQPIDADIQETYQEWNLKKGYKSLLQENGVGNEFNKFYIPKK